MNIFNYLKLSVMYSFRILAAASTPMWLCSCSKEKEPPPQPEISVELKEVRVLGIDSIAAVLVVKGNPEDIAEAGICWTTWNRQPFTTDNIVSSENKASRTFILTKMGAGESATIRAYATTYTNKTIYSEENRVDLASPLRQRSLYFGPTFHGQLGPVRQVSPDRFLVGNFDDLFTSNNGSATLSLMDTAGRRFWAYTLPSRFVVKKLDIIPFKTSFIAIEYCHNGQDGGMRVIATAFNYSGQPLWNNVMKGTEAREYYNSVNLGDTAFRTYYSVYGDRSDSIITETINVQHGQMRHRSAIANTEANYQIANNGVAAGNSLGNLMFIDNSAYGAGRLLEYYGPGQKQWSVILDNIGQLTPLMMHVLPNDRFVALSLAPTEGSNISGLSLQLFTSNKKSPILEATYHDRHVRSGSDYQIVPRDFQILAGGQMLITCLLKSNDRGRTLLLLFDEMGKNLWAYAPSNIWDRMTPAAAFQQQNGEIVVIGSGDGNVLVQHLSPVP